MKLVTSKIMKKLDETTISQYKIPGLELMERAGRGAFRIIENYLGERLRDGIAIVAGSGNNGGDGFVVARYAREKGYSVEVFLLAEPEKLKGDALENYKRIVNNLRIEVIQDGVEIEDLIQRFRRSYCVVDAIFGTGFRGTVSGLPKNVIEAINRSNAKVVAIDIPSGLNPDTGEVMGTAVRAFLTVTFGLPKAGQFMNAGPEHCGRVEVVDIGIPQELIDSLDIKGEVFTSLDVRRFIKPRRWDAHKGNFGHLLIVAGSPGKTGAALLASEGALRSGAGLVTIAVPASLNSIFESSTTEAMTVPVRDRGKGVFLKESLKDILTACEGKDAVALGPGIGTYKETIVFVKEFLQKLKLPVVIDADGLNCLSNYPEVIRKIQSQVILTPHPGEMARLTKKSKEEINRDRIGTSIEFAKEHNCVLLLKGALTVVAKPDSSYSLNSSGNPGMATGGMGDVLTGIIGALLAQGLDPYDAGRCGAFVHGASADLLAREYGPFGYKAGELADNLPRVWKKIFDDFV